MEQLTGLGKTILATDPDKIRLDQAVKNILAYKPLLARIFKEVVSECRDMDYDEIEACIEGEVLISSVYVHGGLSNAGERIDGLSTEAYLNEEGLDKYDLRTYLRLPGKKAPERVKLLINVEAQNEDKPGYDISLRALFYCCRMISAQQGVEFSTDADDPVKYGNIKKVYSIWICTETAQKRANSIERYAINRQMLAGSNGDLKPDNVKHSKSVTNQRSFSIDANVSGGFNGGKESGKQGETKTSNNTMGGNVDASLGIGANWSKTETFTVEEYDVAKIVDGQKIGHTITVPGGEDGYRPRMVNPALDKGFEVSGGVNFRKSLMVQLFLYLY